MSFVETRFPEDIALGASGGAGFSTDIVELFSGHEQRNINWSAARARFNVAHGIKRKDQIDTLIAFFRARRGKAIGFRFKDWSDYEATAQNLGTGNGSQTQFQLRKAYTSGGITVYRTINKPVSGSVNVYVNGVLKASPADYSIDLTTGLITFTSAPANGTTITADFEFDVPARFDIDQMDLTMQTEELGSWSNIPIIEIRV